MPALYLLFVLLASGALVFVLLRPGVARAGTVWVLAALLPVLAALSAALGAQGRAARVLEATPLRATQVTVTTAGQPRTLSLSALDAACLERAVRLSARVIVDTRADRVPIQPGMRVTGALPPAAAVEALTIRGELNCPHVHAQRTR
ncbi:hypothetical protein E7T09_19720 [Deinococcus sp. KSM4-11]|uniref:hypothetical protein n=1 Tax=Deinococcus sp. KSM4-11 TaxID=2568654 RepID=UPI0010A51CB8|nr:hypothetical protein [Deinococcus sp. KSM4-11]THF84863.1 hypothetical protein E7T09_19720 [Deinococcus sp. KSM4-11]